MRCSMRAASVRDEISDMKKRCAPLFRSFFDWAWNSAQSAVHFLSTFLLRFIHRKSRSSESQFFRIQNSDPFADKRIISENDLITFTERSFPSFGTSAGKRHSLEAFLAGLGRGSSSSELIFFLSQLAAVLSLYLSTRLLRGEFAAYSSIQNAPCSNEVEKLLMLLNCVTLKSILSAFVTPARCALWYFQMWAAISWMMFDLMIVCEVVSPMILR